MSTPNAKINLNFSYQAYNPYLPEIIGIPVDHFNRLAHFQYTKQDLEAVIKDEKFSAFHITFPDREETCFLNAKASVCAESKKVDESTWLYFAFKDQDDSWVDGSKIAGPIEISAPEDSEPVDYGLTITSYPRLHLEVKRGEERLRDEAVKGLNFSSIIQGTSFPSHFSFSLAKIKELPRFDMSKDLTNIVG